MSRLLGPFSVTTSGVSERASAFAEDQIAGAGSDAGHGFQKIAVLHLTLQRTRKSALERLRKVRAKS
jgi:hypothetical protein